MKQPLISHDLVRLDHILEAIEDLINTDLNDPKNKNNIHAAAFRFTVIGEASNKISETFKAQYAQLPWREMADMRNKIVHEYESINPKIMRQVIEDELLPLRHQIEIIVKSLLEEY